MIRFTWADVENDLLFLLTKKLCVTTCIRFSAVCKSWYWIAFSSKWYKRIPWLLLVERKGSHLRDLYDHSTRELYQFSLPQGVKLLGFAHGWLITCGEDGSFNLVDPHAGTRMAFPPADFLRYYLALFARTTSRDNLGINATCSPIGPCGDNIVLLTYRCPTAYVLFFCRSNDRDWTPLDSFGSSEPFPIAFLAGAFYILTADRGTIYSLDFSSSDPKPIEIADVPQADFDCYFRKSYIVECAGQILVVVKSLNGSTSLIVFKVFRLDAQKKKVVEVEGIGDYALFLGINNSFCVQSSMYENVFRRNCVYYLELEGSSRFAIQENLRVSYFEENLSVYNFEDGRVTTLSNFVGLSNSKQSFPFWMTLDPLQYSIEGLNINSIF